MTPQPMIGVREEGGLGSLLRRRSQRVLAVGMPSIVGLTVDQFSAILAHEYGHFSNRDTTWGPLTFRSGSALYGTMMQMRAMRHAGGLEGILSWLNPAPLALAGYIRIYMRLTSSFSRACEVLADQGAVSLYGRSAFKTGLRRVVVNDELFHSEFGPKMEELAMEGKSMENVFRLMEETESQATPERIEEIYKKDEERPASKYDTHPPIGDRLSYVDHFEQKGSSTDTRPVSELFTDWQGRATQMSEMLSKHLIDTLN